MTQLFDCTQHNTKAEGIAAAVTAIRDRLCVVIPTDTVYGIAADAFSPQAVAVLLAAKGRGRNMPPPVLISDIRVMDGLADQIPDSARALAEAFWPGALTLILTAQPSLTWDLGDARGTVALRVPDDDLAREVLQQTGPLAVSSANRHGESPATAAEQAQHSLGESVAVYLADGPRHTNKVSTIIDCTQTPHRVVRSGDIDTNRLRSIYADLLDIDDPHPSDLPDSNGESTSTTS